MGSKRLVLLLVVVMLAVGSAPGVGLAQVGDDANARLVRRALSEIGTSCAKLAENTACYGFRDVTAVFSGVPAPTFDKPGDRADLTSLQSLHTSALNAANGVFGIAVLKVRANLHGALPQTAIFTMIGDVELTNEVTPAEALVLTDPVAAQTAGAAQIVAGPGADAAVLGTVDAGTTLQVDGLSPDGAWARVLYQDGIGWVSRAALDPAADLSALPVIRADSKTPLQVFSFRTAGDAATSLTVPPSVLVVQSPEGIPVEIVANGIKLRVNGVAFLRTTPDGRLQVIAANGDVWGPKQEWVMTGTSIIFGQDGDWREWKVLGPAEWGPWSFLEIVWDDIIKYETITVVSPSGIDQREIVIIIPGGRQIIPIPPKPFFPEIPYRMREPGQPLERVVWEPITVGCGVCLPEKVFYHSNADGDWDIYQLASDRLSQPANNVSRGPGSQDIQPSYSADGEWVAFTSNRDILGGWELYVASADGARQQRLTFNTGNDVNPVFGPAGQLVWESDRDSNWELYMADLTTDGAPIRLTNDDANDLNPFWFPDGGCDTPGGSRLVFQSDRDGGDWDIFLLDVPSGEVTQLTANDVEDQMPTLSKDGSQMAWLQTNEYGVYDLWVMDLATRDSRRLTDLGTDARGQVFSDDGQLIAFYSLMGADNEILTVDVASGGLKVVTDNDVDDNSPSFYCDRPEIIFNSDLLGTAQNSFQRQLYNVNPLPLDGPAGLPARLTEDLQADDTYAVSEPRHELNSKQGRLPEHP